MSTCSNLILCFTYMMIDFLLVFEVNVCFYQQLFSDERVSVVISIHFVPVVTFYISMGFDRIAYIWCTKVLAIHWCSVCRFIWKMHHIYEHVAPDPWSRSWLFMIFLQLFERGMGSRQKIGKMWWRIFLQHPQKSVPTKLELMITTPTFVYQPTKTRNTGSFSLLYV